MCIYICIFIYTNNAYITRSCILHMEYMNTCIGRSYMLHMGTYKYMHMYIYIHICIYRYIYVRHHWVELSVDAAWRPFAKMKSHLESSRIIKSFSRIIENRPKFIENHHFTTNHHWSKSRLFIENHPKIINDSSLLDQFSTRCFAMKFQHAALNRKSS